MNAISMALLLDALRVLDECADVPSTNDLFTERLAKSSRAHSVAYRLRAAMGRMPDVAVEDDREQVAA